MVASATGSEREKKTVDEVAIGIRAASNALTSMIAAQTMDSLGGRFWRSFDMELGKRGTAIGMTRNLLL